ncbi:DNA-directed RNA polymerase subunit K/omega [Algoriphagus sp. 4150]|uniref:hypothetical protein n=1 Tax=Algoriphagus sp. 4150 TaxID=2817756 RepID=UPI0028647DD1|nr:hypothetical protein [Algoriphagus sp. 4150]MDR7130575.1 DNA-directed RNA polymerase subunit K/omega [Algoriphagus sp. 4150]
MENPTIKELLEKLSKGELSRDEFDLFLEKLKKEKGTNQLDQAFLEFFEGLAPPENECSNQKPKK